MYDESLRCFCCNGNGIATYSLTGRNTLNFGALETSAFSFFGEDISETDVRRQRKPRSGNEMNDGLYDEGDEVWASVGVRNTRLAVS